MKKNREERRAALEQVLQMREEVITPDGPKREIPETGLEETIELVARGYVQATIGELLEQARLTRKIGKRELARKMGMNHARVSQIEQATNLELKSVLETAQLLEYDVSISLVPREGGKAFGALLKT
jgi:ribosome-binding protein aMBF1 (putative translation factor)